MKSFMKLLKQSKQAFYEKFLETFKAKQSKQQSMKVLETFKVKQARSYEKFYKFYSKASKVSGKCLVKYSFTILRYFQKKQAYYQAYTH